MSQYINAFLTLNLCVEMVYVIAQRLNAQEIPLERSAFVLNEIIAVLVSKELVMDIMKPQVGPYTHEMMKHIIENIVQSSIMRLDSSSMNKLWDLITMTFKWQLTLGSDILKITQRHVSELENYITNGEILLQLRRIQNLVDNFGKILNKNELMALRDDILFWLKNCNVKVSLLLKMGLQNSDGTFVTNNDNDLVRSTRQNLGQNIYALTQINKILQFKRKEHPENTDEVNMLVVQLLGEQRSGIHANKGGLLKLNTDGQKNIKSNNFEVLNVEPNDDKLCDLLSDLNMHDDPENANELREDLLKFIDSNIQL